MDEMAESASSSLVLDDLIVRICGPGLFARLLRLIE